MIKLNCDMGEGMSFDEQIMPLVDMTNLACGAHAGDADMMISNVKLAKEYGVMIGSHPSYPDRENFGRVSVQMSREELISTVTEQVSVLDEICVAHGAVLSYVKPHGALYNDMMKNDEIFTSVVEAVSTYGDGFKLMILSSTRNDHYSKIAAKYNQKLLYELFSDRNYTDEGSLVPRSEANAVIESVNDIVARIEEYISTGELKSINGKALQLVGDSLCVHGDNLESLEIIRALRTIL